MFRNRKGFTLIELLIVMAVIAVLIGIAIPSFRGMQSQAKIAKAEGDLRTVKLAIEAYNASNSVLPTNLTTVEGGSVITKLPKDPFSTGGTANYLYVTSGTYYAVTSVGPDATGGTVAIDGSGNVTDSSADDIGVTNGNPPATNYWH